LVYAARLNSFLKSPMDSRPHKTLPERLKAPFILAMLGGTTKGRGLSKQRHIIWVVLSDGGHGVRA
jgi:hypothetical protein